MFRYQRRSPEQWRAAAGHPIGRRLPWLVRLLNAADRSTRLSAWETSFVIDFEQRLAAWGERLSVSPKQEAILKRIEAKLKKHGAL
jgi:hypothetical protein